MIAKGAARNNPRQLAVYLMRVERYSTGEPVELLELQSGWAGTLEPDSSSSRVASRLIEAFRDWQVLTEGTRQGRDGLYHAEISPAPKYAETMTPEQWKRAADILGEELGFEDQPRAIVLHGGTDGRKHMHVVWARTDVDEMKIISDGYNYVAHEKASHRMELEFGHDFVPGKHDKRDRELQEEFPRQEYDFAEAQMAERAGKTLAERKAQIKALQATSANGQEFKDALENAGYVLARGDRGYIVIDEAGTFSALTKNLQGVMKKAEVEAFMADVPLAQLPTVDEVKAAQESKVPIAEQSEAATSAKSHALSQDERKAQITGIRQQCDNAPAFKNAVEEAGYVLAKGDKRGFVLVDGEGDVFSLSKLLIGDIKGKEYKAFMAPLDPATLPSVDEAKAIQEQQRQEAAAKAEKPPQERSKFLSDELAQKLQQPASAPEKTQEQARPEDTRAEREPAAQEQGVESSRFLRPVAPQQEIPAPTAPAVPVEPAARQPIDFTLYAPKEPETDQSWTERTIAQEFQKADPEIERRNREKQRAAELRAKIEQKELRELHKDIWQEQVVDMQKHAEANSAEYREAEQTTKNQNASKMEDFDIQQQDARHVAQEQIQPEPKPFWLAALHSIIRDEDAEAKKEAERQEQLEIIRARQAQERADYIKKLEQDRARELEALRERHLREQAEREKKHDAELERHIREKKRALELQAEIEANDRARQESGWAEDFKKEQQYPWHHEEVQTERKLTDEFKKADPQADRHQREKQRAAELRAELEAEEREKGLNREKEEGLGEGKE